MSSGFRFALGSAPKTWTYSGLPGPWAAGFNWDGAGTISGGGGCWRVAALGDCGWSFKGGSWRGRSGGLCNEKVKRNTKQTIG